MPTPQDNARTNFNFFAATQDVFIINCKAQIDHARQVTESALSGTYTAAAGIADVTALWINGVATMLSLFGYIPGGTATGTGGTTPPITPPVTPPTTPTSVVASSAVSRNRGASDGAKRRKSATKAAKAPRKG